MSVQYLDFRRSPMHNLGRSGSYNSNDMRQGAVDAYFYGGGGDPYKGGGGGKRSMHSEDWISTAVRTILPYVIAAFI